MSTKLLVGNISSETNEALLRNMFAVHGRVTEVDLIKNRLRGGCRGFVFVTMESKAAAHAAVMALNGKSIGGRALLVNEARAS